MRGHIFLFLAFVSLISSAQNPLKPFEALTGHTWSAEGKWKDGSTFRQETTFNFGLDSTIITTRSKGYTDPMQIKFGYRNYGVRKYNAKTGTIDFWEFDIYGGLTQGTVECQGKNFTYSYEYGGFRMVDRWEYVNDSTYTFIVGSVSDGALKDTFLVSAFTTQRVVHQKQFAIVIHGGAGTITRKNLSEEKEKEIRSTLNLAVSTGYSLLENGKTALEVVEAVVMIMEDSPLFNAGKGAVFNSEGKQEMDACIMDGRDLSSGAVCGVQHLKNPIVGARLVKDSTRHVMLSGLKAENFCLSKGAEYADSSYFFVQSRWDYYEKIREQERNKSGDNDGGAAYMDEGSNKYGTVGCVVLDQYGNLAAATSTGGLTYKEHGRIGDAPVVGAGTYASNNSCAVSCTGTGEFFIRGTVARDISALMEFKGYSLSQAGNETMAKLNLMGGDGGFIAVDKDGNVILLFNTEGMYRGYQTSSDSGPVIGLYKDE